MPVRVKPTYVLTPIIANRRVSVYVVHNKSSFRHYSGLKLYQTIFYMVSLAFLSLMNGTYIRNMDIDMTGLRNWAQVYFFLLESSVGPTPPPSSPFKSSRLKPKLIIQLTEFSEVEKTKFLYRIFVGKVWCSQG